MSIGNRNSRRQGFTLLELVLVMVIICMALGMAAPSLHGFFVSRKSDDVATQVLSLTKLARTSAISEGRTYRMTVDAESGEFKIAPAPNGVPIDVQTSMAKPIQAPEGIKVKIEVPAAPDRNYVDFTPDGMTEVATITVTDIRGDERKIVCTAPTEMFSIETDEESAS